MQTTTALASISPDSLADVVGGCHKRSCGGCCVQMQSTQIQMAAPAPAPVAPPAPTVSTNVSVGYQ